jgi:hypothetical protein
MIVTLCAGLFLIQAAAGAGEYFNGSSWGNLMKSGFF